MVWWNSARPGDEAVATVCFRAGDEHLAQLAALIGTAPIRLGAQLLGIDARVDIYIDPIPDPVTARFSSTCSPAASDIIISAAGRAGARPRVHARAPEDSPRLAPCGRFAYLDDAPAAWQRTTSARGTTASTTPPGLNSPDIRFNFPPAAGYPAWVLFCSAAKRLGASVVPAFHTAAQSQPPLRRWTPR